jgi:uncharacterized protein CbrC (UPF0167 family)
MIENLPIFKYHPDPIGSGVFIPSNKCCPVCNEFVGYEYVGPFFAKDEVDGICPWCIANGKAAEKFDMSFVDEDEIELVDNDSFTEELTKKTPGFFFPQEDKWPSHCGDYCILIGDAEKADVESKFDLIKSDLDQIKDSLEITESVLKADLVRKNSPLWSALFQCAKCKIYRLVANYE